MPIAETAGGSVMPDLEAAEHRRICQRRFGMLPNMRAQFALPNGFEKGVHFVFFARGQKLDPAIPQIADGTGDIEPFCYLPDGITKTDTLDISLIEDLNRDD